MFGDSTGEDDWVCAKIPNDGRIKKDCVPKKEAPGWYVHLLENRDFRVRRRNISNNMVIYIDKFGERFHLKIYLSFQILLSKFKLT